MLMVVLVLVHHHVHQDTTEKHPPIHVSPVITQHHAKHVIKQLLTVHHVSLPNIFSIMCAMILVQATIMGAQGTVTVAIHTVMSVGVRMLMNAQYVMIQVHHKHFFLMVNSVSHSVLMVHSITIRHMFVISVMCRVLNARAILPHVLHVIRHIHTLMILVMMFVLMGCTHSSTPISLITFVSHVRSNV
jgi:hypothetical protein